MASHRRPLLLLPAAALAFASRPARAFVLVTSEEVAANHAAEIARYSRSLRQAPPPPEPRGPSDPDVPQIEVVRPQEAGTLTSPLTIILRFRAATGAQIVPTSFRAHYGLLGLDITNRLLPYARLDASGLNAENAALPSGSHRVQVQIADTRGRVGDRTFRFMVA